MTEVGRSRSIPFVAAAAAASVLVAACTSGQDDTPEDAAQGDAMVTGQADLEADPDQVTLTVTFDGDSCVYDGPEELGPGEVQIEIVNESSDTAWVEMAKLADNVTVEDFVAFHQPEPKEGAAPVELATFVEGPEAWGGNTESVSTPVENGEYALVCLQAGEFNAMGWVAQPVGVTVAE